MEAMKAREKEKLEALRGIKKVMLEAKSSAGGTGELTDPEALKIIQKLAKQVTESAELFKGHGRRDLCDHEMFQVGIFESYLPKKMSNEELTQAIQSIISETGATSMKEMGKVMGIASKKLSGLADGKDISEKVKTLLS